MMAPERPGPEEPPLAAAGRLRGDGGGGRGAEGGAASTPAPAAPAPASLLSPIVQIKEGDGPGGGAAAGAAAPGAVGRSEEAGAEGAEGASPEDDDLTSLTWLQDRNLLRGMKLSPPSGETQESPTSDFAEESTSEPSEASSTGPSPGPTSAPGGRAKHPQHVPYDPMIHVDSKPPYSFSCLIFMAIEDSPQKALPVKEIYAWILERFPYFKNAPTGWKNSVRHNLSLNKCFRKVEKAPNLGKGSLWMVDPVYWPNLLQALQKAPFHPQSSLERIAHIAKNAPHSTPNSGGSGTSSPAEPAAAVKTSNGAGRLPDPELFPYLSRRLAATGVDITPVGHSPATPGSGSTTDEADSLDDVDAATAMLALKHGPRLVAARKDEWFRRVKTENQNGVDVKLKKKRASRDGVDSGFPVITTSPSEDHTYSAGPTVPQPPGPSSSPDEAFGEGSASEDSLQTSPFFISTSARFPRPFTAVALSPTDAEEQRKIAEGADALLNLAGITTRKRSHSTASDHAPQYILPDYPPDAATPSPPAKRINVRGRKRGSSGGGSSTPRARPHLPSPTRQIRKRGGGAASATGRHSLPSPRGGSTNRHVLSRRRGGPHHINNNTIHVKHIKVAGRFQSGSRDQELHRPTRMEDKGPRSRR